MSTVLMATVKGLAVSPPGAHRAGRRPHPSHQAGSRAGTLADPPGPHALARAEALRGDGPHVLQAALQRAGKDLSSRTGGRLRRPALNPVSEAPLASRSEPYQEGGT